jgi:hypothetical protein
LSRHLRHNTLWSDQFQNVAILDRSPCSRLQSRGLIGAFALSNVVSPCKFFNRHLGHKKIEINLVLYWSLCVRLRWWVIVDQFAYLFRADIRLFAWKNHIPKLRYFSGTWQLSKAFFSILSKLRNYRYAIPFTISSWIGAIIMLRLLLNHLSMIILICDILGNGQDWPNTTVTKTIIEKKDA